MKLTELFEGDRIKPFTLMVYSSNGDVDAAGYDSLDHAKDIGNDEMKHEDALGYKILDGTQHSMRPDKILFSKGKVDETKYSDGYDSKTGMKNGRPYNDPMRRGGPEPSNEETLKYHKKRLAELKANPKAYKTHIAYQEKMIRRYSK